MIKYIKNSTGKNLMPEVDGKRVGPVGPLIESIQPVKIKTVEYVIRKDINNPINP
ncbi:hypothetical protein JCM31447_23290 [Fluviispira sanaruensis]|uniref:Uncharacterized protein n=1 Tax=Fluviispira sanaruensis TaxID=2493639 RepID=A0A4P2VKS0_FLUSA|nr:hypothetical protein JCM31447_23290 [Fluviispira sanaruensis]